LKTFVKREVFDGTLVESNFIQPNTLEFIDVLSYSGNKLSEKYHSRKDILKNLQINIDSLVTKVAPPSNDTENATYIYIHNDQRVLFNKVKIRCVFYYKNKKLYLKEKDSFVRTKEIILEEPAQNEVAIECVKIMDKWKFLEFRNPSDVWTKYKFKKMLLNE
jgi:hypothetical protein